MIAAALPLLLELCDPDLVGRPTPSAETPAVEAPAPAAHGLYPLWEQTGALLPAGSVEVGAHQAAVGLGFAQVETQPLLDLYGTANAALKLRLLAGPRFAVALRAAWLRLPTNAESRTIGNLHAASFSNPYAPVTLIPIALAGSFILAPRFHLHAAATLLRAQAERLEDRHTSGGLALMSEHFANERWSVRLHAGVEGWPVERTEHVGLSFAWRSRHVGLALGYARRFGEGTSRGDVMFDAALLFP